MIVAPPSGQHFHDGLLLTLHVRDDLEYDTAEVVRVVNEPQREHRLPLDAKRRHVAHDDFHLV